MPWPVVRRPSVRRPSLALCCPGGSAFSFNRNSFKLTGVQEKHKISHKFKYGPGRIILFRVTHP